MKQKEILVQRHNSTGLWGPEITVMLSLIEESSQRGLLEQLYNGNSPIRVATPEGYRYDVLQKEKIASKPVKIGYFGPHPSDLPDFIGGIVCQLKNATLHEFLLTEGEKGAQLLSSDQARRVRRLETLSGSAVLGNTFEILQSSHGSILPDGEVAFHLVEAKELIKKAIMANNLDVIIAPGPEVDHPDHVATSLATIIGLQELSQEGWFEGKNLPAVYFTDPEYGYGSGGEWAMQKISEVFKQYPYLATMKGFVLPEYIVDISRSMQQAMASLLAHRTQMEGKEYRWKIPMFKRIRGYQIGTMWGEGLRQIKIPGVTSEENSIVNCLPEGSMFRLQTPYFQAPSIAPITTKETSM